MLRSSILYLFVAACGACAGVSYHSIPQQPQFDTSGLKKLADRSTDIDKERANLEGKRSKLAALSPGSVVERAELEEEIQDSEELLSELREEQELFKHREEIRKKLSKANQAIRVSNTALDRDYCGLRFYQVSPFLLVYADGKGGVVWEIHNLPDPTKMMSAKPYNYLSSLQVKLTFDDHFRLMDVFDKGDSTTVPKAVFAAIETVAASIASDVLTYLI